MKFGAFLLLIAVQMLFCSAFAANNLHLGNQMRTTVNKGSMELYKIEKLSISDSDALHIVITPFSGDPDLYINYDRYPSVDENGVKDYKWSSTSTYDDAIVITNDDSKYEPNKEYYIAVYGHSRADFGIVAYTSNETIKLQDGAALSAVTRQNEYAFFEFELDGDSPFSISVSPLEGDPDVFVSVDQAKPTKDDNQWASRNFGFDFLDIRTSDDHYKPNSKYYIGVLGYGTQTTFSILVSKPKSRHIIPDGVPMAGIVEEDEYIYYDFQLFNPPQSSEQRGIFIELKTLGFNSDGDPDLYITAGDDNKNPTKHEHTWGSSGFKNEIVAINTTDDHFQPNAVYHIGVHGFREATYQLVVYTEGDNVILEPGVSVTESVDHDAYKYFKFKHKDTEAGLLFRTFADTGQVSTYISETVTKPKKDNHKHDFEAHTEHNEESLIYISPDENKAQWYWLSVYGEQSYNDFTITASTNQSAEVLEEGETSYFNEVPRDHYRYFIFIVDELKKDLTITVESIMGDTDLYVSNAVERPSNTHYTWKSSSAGTDTVVIKSDDPKWDNGDGRGRLYIAVHGWTQAFFNIRVFLSDKNQPLEENLPTPGYVDASDYTYFEFHPPNAGKITFYVDLKLKQDTMDADLYVSQSTSKPTKEDNQWVANEFGEDFLRIDDAPSKPFYIGVRGVTDSTFSITIGTEMIELFSTESLLDSVRNSEHRNYRFTVGTQTKAVLATVTLVDGVSELYMNTKTQGKPTRRIHDTQDVHFPGNALLLTKEDDLFDTGEWTMSVFGAHSSTYYVSYMESAGLLSQGVPRLGMTSHSYHPLYLHYINAYNTSTMEVAEDHYVYVDIMSGEAEVYVTQEDVVPGPQNHTWVSKGPGDHMIRMSHKKLKPGNLRISVRPSSRIVGSGNFRFTISVNKEDAPIFLTSTVPQEKVTRPNHFSYFSVFTPKYEKQHNGHNVTKKLEVTVESCTPGDAPNFYIGDSKIKHPSKSNNIKASNVQVSSFAQYAAIEQTYSAQTYHIGVDGGANGTTYAIFATSGVNQRPKVDGDFSGSYDKDDKTLTLKLHDASNTNFPHSYYAYSMVYSEEEHGDGSHVNFDTFCAVETFGTHVGTHHIDGPQDKGADSDFKMTLNDLNKDQIYAINVVVESGWSSHNNNPGGEGLKTVYNKKWLVHGELKDSPLYDGGSGYHFKVGWFLVGMGLGLFALYFVVGMIVNAVRGARGIDLIPNVEFWKDLPFMIKDGIIFTFTCGRGTIGGSQSRYQDLDRSHSTNTEQPAGYGSI